ncbi:polyphosphate kinase 1 [Lactobacillaceae bacterium L1_55_11]|nr:polyphosphate kinase 1 [Lactobacillaceae bacterium L1_55_11]
MKLNNPDYYNSREISWVDFNFRVLDEARDKKNPLLERLRFVGINQSNLDEFFNIRIASLHNKIAEGGHADLAGRKPAQQLHTVLKKTKKLYALQNWIVNRSLMPQLHRHQIMLRKWHQLNRQQKKDLRATFEETIFPLVTPLAIDTSRPFPFVANGTLNVLVQLKKNVGEPEPAYTVLPVPTAIPRVIKIAGTDNQFILLDELMTHQLNAWFPKENIVNSAIFRIARDRDIDIDDDTSDLKDEVVKTLQERKSGPVMGIEMSAQANEQMVDWLLDHYHVDRESLFLTEAPVDLTFVNQLIKQVTGHKELLFKPFTPYDPKALKDDSMFDKISQNDILVHHPYDSFNPILRFLQEAAVDPDVLSVKMTLYRVSKHSPVIKALKQAAENGKEVTVMVELKARGDEGNNLHWTNVLESVGCHVVYGLQGLKVHCKLTMVVRKEGQEIKRYAHLGTGNYNDKTARLYTDMGLFTADPVIGEDATKFLNMLSGADDAPELKKLVMSPHHIRDFLIEKIDQEIENAKAGKSSHVTLKMNSFSDAKMIKKIYHASHAGVKVDILVRGICDLRVGIKGVSDNVTVHSIVGRLLEHSRIYIFENGGQPEIYMSSADLMERNLSRRVELLFPVENEVLSRSVRQIVGDLWRDNLKTRQLHHNNEWHHISHRGIKGFNAQQYLIDHNQEIADARLIETGFEKPPKNKQKSKPAQ